MIDPLRRVIESKPFLEPFCTGRASRSLDRGRHRGSDEDGGTASAVRRWFEGDSTTSSANDGASIALGAAHEEAFDAVQYAREAIARSRRGSVELTSGSSQNALDEVAALAEGTRTMEGLIREEVIAKRETLDRALSGMREAEVTMETIRDGSSDVADAVRRVATQLGEPHGAIEAATRTLERLTATGETLRGIVKVLKLTSKLRECRVEEDGSFSDSSELSKAAKLLGEIKATLKSAGGDFDGVDVVEEQMAYIRERSSAISRETNAALDRGMEAMSQANVGAALQVHYNLNELRDVVDARVSFHAASAIDAVKDAMDAEAVGRTAGASTSGEGRRGGRQLAAPPHGAERAWMEALWRRIDVSMDAVYDNAMSVWHLQRVLAKKRDPLTQTLFIEEVVGRTSNQALCDRFWAVFAKGVSEHLSRTHAAAGFIAGALQKGFPTLIGAIEGVVNKCARDAEAAKGAPGCVRKDGSTRAQVLRAVDPIAAAFFARSLTRLTESANNCFVNGRTIERTSADAFLSRIRYEIDAVADYDHLLNNACGNASSALKALADRAKRSIGRSIEKSSVLEESNPTQRSNAQIAEQLSRVHGLLSKVLPSFAPAPRRALEAGLEHVAAAALEATKPFFDAVGDWCDDRFAEMHDRDYKSATGDKGAQNVIAVTSTIAHVAESYPGLFAASHGPLMAARLALGERIARALIVHASLIRELDQGGKMRLVKEITEIENALTTHAGVVGVEAESSSDFKSMKAFKSLVLLPTESIERSPLVADLSPRVLLHHLYSRAPSELHTPAKRASLNLKQYASWLLKRASDAEVWRVVKGTLDVFEEGHRDAARGDVAFALMRASGERLAS